MSSPGKIAVVVAHPDDEVLGCGATVALRVARGWEAHLLVLATGVASRYGGETRGAAAQEIAELQGDLSRAAGVIGFASFERLDYPDNALDTVPKGDLARRIDEFVDRIRPDVLFTHHPGDYNWDHGVVFEASMMAARSSPGEFAPAEILAFEVPSSTERAWQEGSRAFHPNVFVDVSESIATKVEALKCYRGECRSYPHPRSPEGVEILARKRGLEIGVVHAEAFALVRRRE